MEKRLRLGRISRKSASIIALLKGLFNLTGCRQVHEAPGSFHRLFGRGICRFILSGFLDRDVPAEVRAAHVLPRKGEFFLTALSPSADHTD